MAVPRLAPSLPLGKDFGPYHLEKLIATGGMAEVYLAHTQGRAGVDKRLALKVINSECAADKAFVQMLLDEARLTVTLNHPNIVETFDLGNIGGVCFITMEYVEGADFFHMLATLSQRETELPIEAALYVVKEALSGLVYAHGKRDERGNRLNVIHRDVSPQNILLSRKGQVKLTDFGIAKAANVASYTREGVIKGKLVYMSPEQSRGKRVDQRTDVFSAGIVLYEALTGRSLYLEESPAKLLRLVRNAEIRPPSILRAGIDADLDALVMKAVARQPEDRYASAQEFVSALSGYLDKRPNFFGADALATLVLSTVEDQVSVGGRPAPGVPARPVSPMHRDDFAVPRHSIILSAADMKPSDDIPLVGLDELVAEEEQPVARLLLQTEGVPQSFDVGAQFAIGRGGELRLKDGRVSRRHARIFLKDGAYLLEDLKSSNGTYLNKKRVKEPQNLESGDIIHIGPYEMRFVWEREPDTARVARDQAVEVASADILDTPQPQPKPPPSRPEERPREPPPAQPAPLAVAGYVSVELAGETVKVPVGANLSIGHQLGVGTARLDVGASAIVRRADGYWFEPMSNRAGILLNGQPLVEATRLGARDQLQVGPLNLIFDLL